MLSAESKKLIRHEFSHPHVGVHFGASGPQEISHELNHSLQADLAATGAVGAFNFITFFAAVWPILVKDGPTVGADAAKLISDVTTMIQAIMAGMGSSPANPVTPTPPGPVITQG